MLRKHIQPGEKIPLKLTAGERKLALKGLTCLDRDSENAVRDTPSGKPIMMTLDALDAFVGFIAAEANHCTDSRKQKKLDAILRKIERLLESITDEEPPVIIKFEDAWKAKQVADQAVQIAEQVAQSLMAAEQLGTKTKTVDEFPLAAREQAILAMLPAVSPNLKRKLVKQDVDFTVAEVASMTMAVAESLSDAEPKKWAALLKIASSLMHCLKDPILGGEG